MKCSCGYEYLPYYSSKTNEQVGDEPFVRIDCFGKEFETDKCDGGYFGGYEKSFLYGCPKCHTVQFDFV